MFRRVLIANRGEIALRVIRACHEVGAQAVVVHSAADRDGPWIAEADAAVCVGPARADDSYLNGSAILEAALQQECQALHPGYGFLSENAEFAARCAQAGLTFIGPSAASIRNMGDKSRAKQTLARFGLPTIPGSAGTLSDVAQAQELANDIGFPVLLKATAGGGGKGMRRCDEPEGLANAYQEASLEAEKAFGNPALYLEKFVRGGRHIEFQILADAEGQAIHLGERDCSIQRKHQKLIEESPSTAVDAATRERMGARVAQAVAASGYRNAGTVEFLRDASGELYFMEMNTRLQVEHPVSEMVTGVDLVVEQLHVAANHPLRYTQDQIGFTGHAVEFRINAEDPERDFAPDAGTIENFQPPPAQVQGARVRWDSAVRSGYKIPPHYDSMVGKLIVHGNDRPATLAAAKEALQQLRIEGIKTTIPLHLRLLDDPAFLSGNYDIEHLAKSSVG